MSLTETPEHWPPDSQKCFFIGRVLKEVPEPQVWVALCSGDLEARIYSDEDLSRQKQIDPYPERRVIYGLSNALWR